MQETVAIAPQSELEDTIGRKVLRRLVFPSALFILMGALDRNNVSFAALHMNEDLGLSGTQYGFGAGVLFVGYLLAKYPSVLLLERIGFRMWLGIITIVWSLAAFSLGLVRDEWELYTLRVVLGFAEGGLSSGLMIYLTHWAPERYRASVLSIPIMAISLAQVIGGPVSGLLLDLDQPFGVASWRFMFFVEALPALILGLFALTWFPDRPANAKWLSDTEKGWLREHVKGATTAKEAEDNTDRWAALTSPMGWVCAFIWFCLLSANYGIIFWLPQILQGMSDLTPTEIGFIVALPNLAAVIALILNARHSDKTGERAMHVAVPSVLGGTGLLVAYLLGPGIPGLLALVFGGAMIGCTVAAFWAIPTRLLKPESQAMGVVMINILGGLAGVTIPPLMGVLRETSGSFLPPTLLLFTIAIICAALCVVAGRALKRLDARQPAQDAPPAVSPAE